MEAVLEWMKGIVILFVVLSALLHLVPKAKYKKYIQFFIEMVIVVAVIQPVSSVIFSSEDFEKKIQYSQFWQEMENLQKDVEKMDFMQGSYYKEEYENAIAEDIRQMAAGKEYDIAWIDVTLTDDYELESVKMELAPNNTEKGAWGVDEVTVGKIGEESLAGKTILNQQAQELKEEIMSFYQLKEEQLVIEIKE